MIGRVRTLRGRSVTLAIAVLAWVALGAAGGSAPDLAAPHAAAGPHAPARNGCLDCHAGIEDIHPGHKLSCVDCHGGDANAATKERAHVRPAAALPTDERVLGADFDLPWQRFRNPSNLRVAQQVCGDCHGQLVDHVLKSLHATTTGHLGDGYYEHGLVDSKRPRFGVFPIKDEDGHVPDKALRAVEAVPPPRKLGRADAIETHYADLPRKACMQCHLWSSGRAVRGRLGMDGDYRGEGCAACHVPYAEDGRSRSRDATIPRDEPGHPREHRFTSKITTETCASCHYGDASIGLTYRGMAQLVPGMPAGPDVPGTTKRLLNGTFYIQDPVTTPPDVHHAAGMHCIDCHTSADVMGDGNLWPQMDHAVEIECTSCHGTFTDPSELTTSHGRRVTNLVREGDAFWLTSKVTGKRHRVKQACEVIDAQHRDFDPAARDAMNAAHARLECYACHGAWNVGFFGFHFDRNHQFTQLDLLSGERTPGRVTTQEKVFASFNQLRLGFNHEAAIAPYMVGFSTIGSARGEDGDVFLRQAAPVTKAGLSGVTLVPHQTHAVRKEVRTCVECHRSPATWGLGSPNFRLTREVAHAITERAFVSIAVDGRTPSRTQPIASLALPDEARALALRMDEVRGRATHAFVAGASGSLHVIDTSSPAAPKLVKSVSLDLVEPRAMLCRGDWLYLADGVGGVLVVDVEKPELPRVRAALPTRDASALDLAWPWLAVADGAGGLCIVDVADPLAPRVLATADLNGGSSEPNEARDVTLFFQYSRLQQGANGLERSAARLLAFVACGLDGVRIVDLTEPAQPVVLHGAAGRRAFSFGRGDTKGVAVNTVFDIGTEGGGVASGEHDYLYVFVETGNDANRQQSVRVFDVSDPFEPRAVKDGSVRVYGGTGRLRVVRAYNEPFLAHFVVAAGAGGLGTLVETGRAASTGPRIAATWDDLDTLRDLQFEELAFDRLVDERGRWIKDISHEDCRYLEPAELLRVLRAPLPVAAYRVDPYGTATEPAPRIAPGARRTK
ncbi:MAG: hypothetical protein IT457_04355 [Planctomycetes bacterium]|nr:hypothetical protein [Planctomycetota bacterium]